MGEIPRNAMVSAGELTPGEHLRAEIERLGLDQIAVSAATGVSRQSINNIVNDRQPISRMMAAKLGRLTGHSSDYWLRASYPAAVQSKNAALVCADVSPPESFRPLGVGVLVNHQIIRAVKDGVIGIDPFDETNVHMASIDLTLDDFIITTDGDKIDVSDGQAFALKGGRAVNVCTKEWIELPQDYIGRVGAMASLAKLGLMTSHGFQIDPGFRGNLQFCIFNAGQRDFELRSGDPIISIEFMPLSALPAFHERAAKHLAEAGDREKVISIFQSNICDRMVRDAIRARVQVAIGPNESVARIVDLNIETIDASADAAIDNAVQAALSGLKGVFASGKIAFDEREKYFAFFSAIVERLYLSGDQARRALAVLGVTQQDGENAVIVPLRNGTEVVVPLPTKSAKISLRHLALQLREEPFELVLLLTGEKTRLPEPGRQEQPRVVTEKGRSEPTLRTA